MNHLWNTLMLLGAWATPTPPQEYYQYTDTSTVVMIEFSQPMSMDGLLDADNYQVIDMNGNLVKIYKVGLIDELDGISITDTTLVALVTAKVKYKTSYTVYAWNVKNNKGIEIQDKNEGWFFFNGFTPWQEQKPYLIVK